MRMRKKPWANGELSSNKNVVKNANELKGKWNEFFGNDNPIFLEIGCGKGSFLNKNKVKYPHINFIGIEQFEPILASAARQSREQGNEIALFCGYAENLLDYFAEGEVSRIFLNFSDPWPRKKWGKRRLTHKNFLDKYKIVLKPYGEIFFKTDNRDLFEFSINQLADENFKLANISLDLHKTPYQAENIMTEYEEKFSSQGLPIYRCEAKKQN